MTTFVLIAWAAFWLYWLIAAATAKAGTHNPRSRPAAGLIIVVFVLLRLVRGNDSLTVHSLPVQIVGLVLLVAGLGLAVWARIYLGRNWGMPMTEKDEPELVTSGPYRFVRHPIYAGILLAILGSALATSLYWLIALVALGIYFVYSARVEEGLMSNSFPSAYPGYKAHTKMLIPFVL
jgi:protein-S-isoprenylcysteine O-methyltransferase Ste14